jgi:hypothetical protein
MPRVSVLIPVWNAARYLSDTLASLGGQTFSDYELVAVDDGSTDGSEVLLEEVARKDARVRVIRHRENRGLQAALNSGLAVATGDLIARQDADDTMACERLARQVSVMDRDTSLVMLGSAYHVIREDGTFWYTQIMPETDTAIRWRLLFDNPINHSSIMFRRIQPDGTPVRYESHRCEDYDLWARLLRLGRACNLPEPLVTRREHGETYTIREEANQTAERNRIALREITIVAPGAGFKLDDVRRLHGWYFSLPSILGPEDLILCRKLLGLLSAFERQPMVERMEARKISCEWMSRILVAIPDYRYRLSWRMGLMGRLLLAKPGLVIGDLRRRVGARRKT